MIHIFIILAHAAMFGGATVVPSSLTYRNIGLDNKLFTENVVFESAVSNDMQCARLCSQHDDCQSFTFASTVCRGHSLLVTSNPSSSLDAAGAQTFEVDECASGPCQNGGSCVDQVNAYTCICQAGYTGIRCETEVDECASGPCQNGGSCVDQVNAYTCICQAGYTGIRCETDMRAVRTDDLTANDKNKSCTTDNDCTTTNMSCYSGQCLCDGGYFFSNSQFVCVQNCSHYGVSYLHYKDFDLWGHDTYIIHGRTNFSTCASFCNQNAACVLFVTSPSGCYLKSETPHTFPEDWISSPGAGAYQRTCA